MHLFPHQVIGTDWMLTMLKSHLHSCILADDMGLGKTFQALACMRVIWNFIAAQEDDNASDEDRDTHEWESGLALVICPLGGMAQWATDIRAFLPKVNIVMYNTEHKESLTHVSLESFQRETIVISTAEIMNRRHGAKARKTWAKDQGRTGIAVDESKCPINLNKGFVYTIFDEAHTLKTPTSLQWQTLKNLRGKYRILLTGTPISNRVEDLEGVSGLMESDTIWEDLGETPGACNPFSFSDGDKRALLQTTQTAMEIMAKEKDETSQSDMINSFYKRVMLKRTYFTVIDGKTIGDTIPAHRTTIVHLKVQDALQVEHLQRWKSHAVRLFKKSRVVPKGMIMMADQARQLSHLATYLGWDGFVAPGGDADKYRKGGRDLHDLIVDIHKQVGTAVMGFDPTTMDKKDPDFKKDLLFAIAKKSPKLRYISWLAADIVFQKKTKAVAWVDYPWAQLLIELFLQFAGVTVESLSSG
ncbi:uncharacterized protein RSE6_14995 [Rhynchosporium secalis]|uniref:Helicase ATP-binding domain-containing protein n=1 Tax=Rhynchosporium secalis TaxID=38038 RepID=A0A1E1MWG8_RHYSE|nr:uncharacterized protein RSE6_14995 [Rhynchosporium secalis]